MSNYRKFVGLTVLGVLGVLWNVMTYRQRKMATTVRMYPSAVAVRNVEFIKTAENAKNANISSLHKSRQEQLVSGCESDKYRRTYRGWYTIDPVHKMLLCPVPKIGSTFWRMLIAKASQKPTSSRNNVTSQLKNVTSKIRESPIVTVSNWKPVHRAFRNYTRVVFARNPYSRIYSAYIDKLLAPNYYYWSYYGSYIAKYIRKNADKKSLKCGHNITFAEFIKYIIHVYDTRSDFDVHIVPVTWHCSPCDAKYEIIGKMETFHTDVEYVAKKCGLDAETVDIKKRISDYSYFDMRQKVEDTVRWLYKENLLSCINENEVVAKLWQNLQLRGKIHHGTSSPAWTDFMHDGILQVAPLLAETNHAVSTSRNKSKERSAYKKAEFIKAYQSVPLEDKTKIAAIYHHDFHLFGYDPRPPQLFSSGKV